MRNPVAGIVAFFSSLLCMAALTLTGYAVYRHYQLPPTGRGHDVWGSLMCFGIVIAVISAGTTTAIVDEFFEQTNADRQLRAKELDRRFPEKAEDS